jgi:hypothetical protein
VVSAAGEGDMNEGAVLWAMPARLGNPFPGAIAKLFGDTAGRRSGMLGHRVHSMIAVTIDVVAQGLASASRLFVGPLFSALPIH